ncbi:MAG: sulfatase [Planctomycetota bacterium]|nr:MAG: sulfatase [Planctomycetota bacterium]
MRRCFLVLCSLLTGMVGPLFAADRPNILWISSEDNGPALGCYGDQDARTPHLDALARKSVIYRNCWSNAPVCAPARTTIITGMFCPSTGSEHMRSEVQLPAGMKMFPQYLRDAGYYCTNNVKEDYNITKPGPVWNESSNKAHWKNRAPGQPFFSVFNFTTTHESQVRNRPHAFIHSPGDVHVPGFHPDLPEVREAWAQYHDQMSVMDTQAGQILEDLERAGLTADTIVVYFGDHGPGLPRCKRSPCNSGLRVPLILHIPDQFKALAPEGYAMGQALDRPVSFVDLAPTMLSLAGLEPPPTMQGRAFAGPQTRDPCEFQFGYRARMDERLDLTRSVRWKNWVYVRNLMPHKTAGQFQTYMYETPMMLTWKKAYDAGTLPIQHARFFQPDAPEELYNLDTDPAEVNNLATCISCQDELWMLRRALHNWQIEIGDIDILPEAEMHRRTMNSTPYELGHNPQTLRIDHVLATAELASDTSNPSWNLFPHLLAHPEPGVRYWAAMGLMLRGTAAVSGSVEPLAARLTDESPAVRTMVAEALLRTGCAEGTNAREVLLAGCADGPAPPALALQALNALDDMEAQGLELFQSLPAAEKVHKSDKSRNHGEYRTRMLIRLQSKIMVP